MNEELKVIITAETAKMQKEVTKARKSIKEFAKDGMKHMKALGDEFKKYGDAAGKALKVAAGAAVGATTALLATSAATSEYREAQAKLTTAFEAAGSSAETAKSTFNDLYKVLGDSDVAVEAANHLAKLTKDQKSLSEWTNICQGVYATFGDSLPIEGLTEAANETAKTGALTGVLADALNWAGINEEAFQEKLDACNTEAEREATIRNTLNGLYSEASSKYAENNAQILAQNEANRKMNDAMAALGETMAPVNTMLTELGAEILADLTPYIKDFADKYLPVIKEVLSGVGEKIGECITWIADNWDTITQIGGIVLGIAAALKAVSVTFGIVNAVAAASPVTWTVMGIVAAVAALTAGVILCYQHWDEIKTKVHEVVESVKGYVADVKADMSAKFNGIKEDILSAFNKAKDGVKWAIDKIKGFFDFEWKLPKIKLPHFSISGEFSLNPPSIPHFGVSWYARGGVFDKPSLFPYGNGSIGGLGEAGAEAVVPLEKNLKWLDKLADMLNDRMGNNNMVLMVDDRVLGEVTVGAINGITRSTGTLPLVLR